MISNIAILKRNLRKKYSRLITLTEKVMGRVKFIKEHFQAILTKASCLDRQPMQ